jgi:hypothetical protein
MRSVEGASHLYNSHKKAALVYLADPRCWSAFVGSGGVRGEVFCECGVLAEKILE